MKSTTGSQHNFAQVPQVTIPRSVFNRSHGYKTTFNAGYLIPFYTDEALPGDSFRMNSTLYARMTTPLYPLMDNLYMDVHFFAVPLRLLWTNFQAFMGEQATPLTPTDYRTPKVGSGAGASFANGTLWDYFGLPCQVNNVNVAAFHSRAYNLIWNDWYRDENLQTKATVDLGDGPDTAANYVLKQRGKRHDYFTSALPWPQKGPAVALPLGTSAPVLGIGAFTQAFADGAASVYDSKGANPTYAGATKAIDAGSNDRLFYVEKQTIGGTDYPNIRADLSSATAATINSLRQAFQLQRMYERDARGGTRYTEIIRSHFGVVSPDARLQRPEYLGGSTARVNITPVVQNSPKPAAGTTTPLGSLAGVGVISARAGFTKSFTEHSVIIGLLSVRADLTYQQGIDRMWSRDTRWDFYWPALAHLGEQSVLNKEIYFQNTADDDLVFGYQERWAEYRYKPSKITGQFRSNYATPLDAWHLAQNFVGLPTLGDTFIKETPPMSRVLAVSGGPDFILDSFNEVISARPMPVYSVPGMIDHF